MQFTTIYPGWYRGRTIHIHFRVRTFRGLSTTFNFASQFYFDDATSDQVVSRDPYNTRGIRGTTTTNDNIYSAATLLALTSDGSGGYTGNFDVALNGLPVAAGNPTPTATATASPVATPAPCVGDCDNGGSVTVDELVKGVSIALDDTNLNSCVAFDSDGSGAVTIDELVTAVNAALNGCP